MGQNFDDLDGGGCDLEEIEMLSERIKEFETASFNAKLRVTDLDKVALKCQLLPKQILASFLLLKEHHESEEKDAQEV